MENLNEKIYDKILEIVETTARQEERLGHIDKHLEGINGKVHDHCGRIKIIEKAKTHNKGFIAGIMIVVTTVVGIVWSLLDYLT